MDAVEAMGGGIRAPAGIPCGREMGTYVQPPSSIWLLRKRLSRATNALSIKYAMAASHPQGQGGELRVRVVADTAYRKRAVYGPDSADDWPRSHPNLAARFHDDLFTGLRNGSGGLSFGVLLGTSRPPGPSLRSLTFSSKRFSSSRLKAGQS